VKSPLTEHILAFGHPNVLAIHPTTLMITKDKELSKQGDCIIAVGADKSLADLGPEFKQKLRDPNTKLTMLLEVDGLTEQVNAFGSDKLNFTSSVDIVVRKSDFASDRTLAIKADRAANDLPRTFVEKLQNPQNKILITLILT
jgi:hypothetical protein